MEWTPRRLAGAAAVAGALILGGAGWAAAQDSPTTTSPNGSTPSTEAPGAPSQGQSGESGTHQRGDCPHAHDNSQGSGDSSGGYGQGSGSPEASLFST